LFIKYLPKGQTPTPLMTSLTKNLKSKTKKIFSLQTRRLVESFGGLNSSLAKLTGQLCSC